MDAALQTTIDTLMAKISAKETEANDLKKLVNGLCRDSNEALPFPDVQDTVRSLGRIRSDQFYGQPLAAAMRTYLEMRKGSGMGAAPVNEIYAAIKQGGFKFHAKDDDNAKNGLRISLRKNSTIFHRLPNGEYGLAAWYPNAKPVKAEENDSEEADDKSKDVAEKTKGSGDKPATNQNFLTNDQIRAAVMGFQGEFKATDVLKSLLEKHLGLQPRPTAIPTQLYALKEAGLLKITKPRFGSAGATYQKA